MKQIKTAGKDLILLSEEEYLKTPILTPYKCLGLLSELPEEECIRFVEKHDYTNCQCYRDYQFLFGAEDYEKEHLYDYFTAYESLLSLLLSHNIDIYKELILLEVL